MLIRMMPEFLRKVGNVDGFGGGALTGKGKVTAGVLSGTGSQGGFL